MHPGAGDESDAGEHDEVDDHERPTAKEQSEERADHTPGKLLEQEGSEWAGIATCCHSITAPEVFRCPLVPVGMPRVILA
jgi:hypothetical protein